MIAIDNSKEIAIKQKVGVIGIPHMGTFPWQTSMSFHGLQMPPNHVIKYHLIGSCLVYDARDKIIQFAKNENADWIVMVDADMVIPSDILYKFVNTVMEEKELEMVSGMCFKRTYPFQPCFYTKARINPETKKPELESPIDFPNEGMLECEGFGMACVFIRMSAIEKIEKVLEKNKLDSYFFPYPGVGEDLSFCIRARMAGIKMYTDLSISVGHVAQMEIRKEHFIMARDQHLNSNTTEPLFKEEV